MTRFAWRLLMIGVAVAAGVVGGRASGQTPDPESVVKAFYANIAADKNPDAVLDLFLTPDTLVIGISGGAGQDKIYTRTARQFVEAAKVQFAPPHVVDTVTVSTVDETLAAATVRFHTRDVNCKAVFTLTREGGDWRITSYAWETQLRDQPPPAVPRCANGNCAPPPLRPAPRPNEPCLPPVPPPAAKSNTPTTTPSGWMGWYR